MFLVESIEISSGGIARFGVSTYNSPIVATIRNPESFPITWNALGRIYKILPINLDGDIRGCIAEEQRIYINKPNFCDFGGDTFTVGFLPVRWLYSKSESTLFLDIYG
jgi:hypothetical protein